MKNIVKKNKIKEIQYFIDTDKGVVVAKLECLDDDYYNIFQKIFRRKDDYLWRDLDIFENLSNSISKYPKTLSAKATLAPGDTFDLDFGMRLARNRLLEKVYRNRYKVLKECENYFSSMAANFKVESEKSLIKKQKYSTTRFED